METTVSNGQNCIDRIVQSSDATCFNVHNVKVTRTDIISYGLYFYGKFGTAYKVLTACIALH